MFEETRRGTLSGLSQHYHEQGPPRGEIAVVVAGAQKSEIDISQDHLDNLVRAALASYKVKDAANAVAQATGLPRRDVYARAVALSKGGEEA
jgi:16S rRNA (cytidine1402-2'-O)-methyltransferase